MEGKHIKEGKAKMQEKLGLNEKKERFRLSTRAGG
jgi:hypothetical protein